MSRRLRLKFDPNQDYQLQAVESVVLLFEGYTRHETPFRLGDEIVPNIPASDSFDRTWLAENLRAVQEENHIDIGLIGNLDIEQEMVLEGAGNESWEYPSITVEMETGTGKTYVYLRTIHELRKRFGFGKFIVVVPSLAIYEGVIKTFEITRDHFAALYGNERVNLIRYDGTQLSRLRTFATSTFCEVLVITLDAFNKITNNIYKPSERLPGERRPYQFIQETRPILILDEPQNMESPIARSALATLHPLFSLRYSATHRRSPNLVYRLTPFEAFRRNLVKRIQVWGVTESEDFNRPFLSLESISRRGGIRATVITYKVERGITREAQVVLRQKDDLFTKAGREEHRGGYVVAEIHAGEQWLRFENGIRLDKGATVGPSRPEIFRVQIEEAVRRHLHVQERLRHRGIKVLSLFFIDRVANYTREDGIIRTLFDETFLKLRKDYDGWSRLGPVAVRAAYFATRQTKQGEEPVELDPQIGPRNAAEREAAKAAYALIMRDKERLLSLDEPVAFIFAHSALREGWDNPNVFQICTLNQTVSEIKKRQEIGRGLRLCVNQDGERIRDDEVNVLTVVANQSYESYAKQLQEEYVEDGEGEAAPPKPGNARQAFARRNEAVVRRAEFKEFWEKLSRRVGYRITLNSDELARECVERLAEASYPEPKVVVQKGEYVVRRYTVSLESVRAGRARIRVDVETTRDQRGSHAGNFESGDDLAQLLNDPRLRGFTLSEISAAPSPLVVFENRETIYQGAPKVYESVEGQHVREQVRAAKPISYPVFDLIGRTVRETGLTRTTVNEIFRRLPRRVKEKVFRNPEGFASVFVSTIRNALADRVADQIEFIVEGVGRVDVQELFPKEMRFAQRELLPAGTRGLYDQVQKDSGVEETFIDRLKSDDKVVLFFKFPPAFKIGLPKLIGSYNPDWGIVRRDDTGKLTLHLVRETKGTEDLRRLQFPQEKRKVVCATKYFTTTDIDYRVVSDRTVRWWEPWRVESVQAELLGRD